MVRQLALFQALPAQRRVPYIHTHVVGMLTLRIYKAIRTHTQNSANSQTNNMTAPVSPDSLPVTRISLEDDMNVVYFDEGPGYLFCRRLGIGREGIASLVLDRESDKTVVRKEARRLTDVHKGARGELWLTEFFPRRERKVTAPPKEYRIARKLQHIPGVAQALGWVLYHDFNILPRTILCNSPSSSRSGKRVHRALKVSYWQYYNLGYLTEFIA